MEERLTALQHVHRGRRALRLRQSRRHDHRLSPRPAVRAGRARRSTARSRWWKSIATEPGATFDDVKRIDGDALEPVVTWGINPEMSVGVSQRIPAPESAPEAERPTYREALAHMGFEAGQPIKGAKIDVAFVGSCTNGRLSDLRIAAEVAKKGKVAKHVRALIVPGSQQVAKAAEAEGLHEIFQAAGFEWRKAGCSMCLGMNDDKLAGPRDERVVQQPQLHRPPGQPHRPHAPDEPGHGRRRRHHRRRRRREGDAASEHDDRLQAPPDRRPRHPRAPATTSTPTASSPRASSRP